MVAASRMHLIRPLDKKKKNKKLTFKKLSGTCTRCAAAPHKLKDCRRTHDTHDTQSLRARQTRPSQDATTTIRIIAARAATNAWKSETMRPAPAPPFENKKLHRRLEALGEGGAYITGRTDARHRLPGLCRACSSAGLGGWQQRRHGQPGLT